MKDHQPIETNPRKNNKIQSGGVVSFIRTGIEYELLNYDANIECSLTEVKYHLKEIKVICFIYRPETYRLPDFFPEFKKLLCYVKNTKYESLLFGDFNTYAMKNGSDTFKYINPLIAYDFGKQNIEPKSVISKSKICLDQTISGNYIETETLRTTISDYNTVLRFIAFKPEGAETTETKMKTRDLRIINGGDAQKLLFGLDRKLTPRPDDATAETQVTSFSNLIMESVKGFAPEKQEMQQEKSGDCISEKIHKQGVIKSSESGLAIHSLKTIKRKINEKKKHDSSSKTGSRLPETRNQTLVKNYIEHS